MNFKKSMIATLARGVILGIRFAQKYPSLIKKESDQKQHAFDIAEKEFNAHQAILENQGIYHYENA